jgi:shikimate kinase
MSTHRPVAGLRIERLDPLDARHAAAMLALLDEYATDPTGGSIVTEPDSFDLLLATCHVVWLRAAPEDHIRRVAAQGDWRPIQASRDAMNDARAILESRAALYGQAHAVIDTSGLTVADAAARLTAIIRDRLAETDIAAG